MAEADVQQRDRRGEWLPESLPEPSPLFSWPLRLRPVVKSVINFYWPYNIFYAVLAVVCWLWFTPDLSRTGSFSVGWIAEIYARNAVLIIVLYGAVHLRLYIQRAQGDRYKYNSRWPSANNRTFLFKDQTRDNVFWTLVSGGLIWTGYEAVTLWMYANGALPMVAFSASPVYFVLVMLAVPWLRTLHFYWTHRLTHWKPLYKAAHYLHHKNVNPGPWSGLAMHPVEHLLYFSGVLLHWIITPPRIRCMGSSTSCTPGSLRFPPIPASSRSRSATSTRSSTAATSTTSTTSTSTATTAVRTSPSTSGSGVSATARPNPRRRCERPPQAPEGRVDVAT